jgi:hypothetical protein
MKIKINLSIKEKQLMNELFFQRSAKTLDELFKHHKRKYNHTIVFDDTQGDEIW